MQCHISVILCAILPVPLPHKGKYFVFSKIVIFQIPAQIRKYEGLYAREAKFFDKSQKAPVRRPIIQHIQYLHFLMIRFLWVRELGNLEYFCTKRKVCLFQKLKYAEGFLRIDQQLNLRFYNTNAPFSTKANSTSPFSESPFPIPPRAKDRKHSKLSFLKTIAPNKQP